MTLHEQPRIERWIDVRGFGLIIGRDALSPQNNNLTAVRILLASSVIWTHSIWSKTGVGGQDQISRLVGQPLSVFAVDGFFFLSGFLVYGSLLRRASVPDFLFARLARLWPALAMSVIGTVIAGAFVTSAPNFAYLGGPTLRFIASNLSLTFASFTLTGVRCGIVLCPVNGSLWTIPWEVRCYLLLAFLWLAGLAQTKPMLYFILPTTLLFAVALHLPDVDSLIERRLGHGAIYFLRLVDRLWVMFALGIAAYLARERFTLRWWPLFPLLVAMIVLNALGREVPHLAQLFTALIVLDVGFLSARRGAISGNWPDYSYGIYVYAFPVMLAVAGFAPSLSASVLAGLTMVVTLPIAALSWHLVERPALALAHRYRGQSAQSRKPMHDQ